MARAPDRITLILVKAGHHGIRTPLMSAKQWRIADMRTARGLIFISASKAECRRHQRPAKICDKLLDGITVLKGEPCLLCHPATREWAMRSGEASSRVPCLSMTDSTISIGHSQVVVERLFAFPPNGYAWLIHWVPGFEIGV